MEKGFFVETQERIIAKDPQTIALVVALIVGVITLVVFFLLGKKRNFGRGILLCGSCDSGKTTLLGHLLTSKIRQTYTSMKENSGQLELPGKKPVNVVDIPGSERIRENILSKYAGSARGIIYVIDSATIAKQLRDVTEFLFHILSKPVVYESRPKVLIACNKQDLGMVKGANVIQGLLEKEINNLRVSQSNRLEGTEQDSENHIFLGKQGKDFAFADLKINVTFMELSVQQPETLDQLRNWIVSAA